MKINIGNNNDMKNVNIGQNNEILDKKESKEDKNNKIVKIIIEIVVGIIIAGIVFWLGWN